MTKGKRLAVIQTLSKDLMLEASREKVRDRHSSKPVYKDKMSRAESNHSAKPALRTQGEQSLAAATSSQSSMTQVQARELL